MDRLLRFGWVMAVAAGLLCAAPAMARDPQVSHGRDIVENNCARCHAVGRTDVSPLKDAPPFRTLHNRYPVDMLAEALAEGIIVGHPEMPKFVLEPDQIAAVIAYLKSLETRR